MTSVRWLYLLLDDEQLQLDTKVISPSYDTLLRYPLQINML